MVIGQPGGRLGKLLAWRVSPARCPPGVGGHTGVAIRRRREGSPSGSAGKNPPPSAEMQVQSLGQEDPLEEEMATMDRGACWAAVHWVKESDVTEGLNKNNKQ